MPTLKKISVSLSKKLPLLLIISTLLIGSVMTLLFIISARVEISNQYPDEHLIPNVTYYGQYLGTILSNQEPVAVRTILSYWGNSEFNDETLIKLFETNDNDFKPGLNLPYVANFFRGNGFTVEYNPLSDLMQIKSLIANNVPAYVQQKLLTSTSSPLYSTRVYIGYSDIEKILIVHDNNFGNNFTITYDEFEQMNVKKAGLLVIRPLKYELNEKPNLPSANQSSYPQRLDIMDDLGLRDVQIKLMLVNYHKRSAALLNIDGVSDTVKLLEEIITHEAFSRLHPAARFNISYNLTGFYMSEVPNYKRAIEILENITLPLQSEYVFEEPFGEWDRKIDSLVYSAPYWTATPWARLGFLYMRMGNNEKARESFNTALSLIPDYPEAVAGLSKLD